VSIFYAHTENFSVTHDFVCCNILKYIVLVKYIVYIMWNRLRNTDL